MPQAPLDPPLPESSSLPRSCSSPKESPPDSQFSHLRSIRWRIDLGILPSSPTSSIDDLRSVAAVSRRRYAGFRRRLLIDPHVSKEVDQAPDLVMENPLSQNPDSMWGRFFWNAELEKMVEQDLSHLHPEYGYRRKRCMNFWRLCDMFFKLMCNIFLKCGDSMKTILLTNLMVYLLKKRRLSIEHCSCLG
ncbi:hypothetical protein MRB53_023446 [Persea americana]|uniref:Uncharacterized protein n=1 Tax=Persea americana TaxID=3435 RepID=A0ACC2LAE8_PERAE|nr:hypothetical protein MRB53_023446 [Persea americana]